jgi:hypothetical protein
LVSDPARWPARRSPGGDAALWIAIALLFLALAALVFGGSREPGLTMFSLCLVAAVLAAMGGGLLIWALGYRRLAYELTNDALRIEWLGRALVVPYGAIQGIYTGQRLEGQAAPSMPQWPGISVGQARVRGLGRLRFYATAQDQSALTFITVEHGGVIISPADPAGFRGALIERVEQAPEDAGGPVTWHQTAASSAPWTALTDVWLPIAILAGVVLLLMVVAVIIVRYDALPDQLALHFDASGRANQVGSTFDLLRLPFLGLLCLTADWAIGVWVHPRERLLARTLWVGGAVVQLVLLVGVVRLVT